MSRTVLLVFGVTLLTACGGNEKPKSVSEELQERELSTTAMGKEDVGSTGQETYEVFCASCHDAGLAGAPVTGISADWQNRSQLWQAVLMEHAKAGYLEMPAKGGEGELSDLSVSHAVEYMMLVTFPDKMPDQ